MSEREGLPTEGFNEESEYSNDESRSDTNGESDDTDNSDSDNVTPGFDYVAWKYIPEENIEKETDPVIEVPEENIEKSAGCEYEPITDKEVKTETGNESQSSKFPESQSSKFPEHNLTTASGNEKTDKNNQDNETYSHSKENSMEEDLSEGSEYDPNKDEGHENSEDSDEGSNTSLDKGRIAEMFDPLYADDALLNTTSKRVKKLQKSLGLKLFKDETLTTGKRKEKEVTEATGTEVTEATGTGVTEETGKNESPPKKQKVTFV
ncbi:MAG: hypothetical protein N0C90_20360 [Candidatus Thiodiazotropha endolucinida]|nr:hypothetical protein [Candidatus Thiodiazotropha taylori]MCW4263707.1 hypothetical protein [Candidatus Thiodiazotropha endolucinida]